MALATLVVSANAQSLSVQNIEAQTGEETQLVVSLSEGTSMTALQFNLALPQGVTLNESAITKGEAVSSHTLSVQTMDSGDRLVVLYHTDLESVSNGTLLRLPITLGQQTGSFSGSLYTIRTASTDLVSHKCNDAAFTVKVKEDATSIVNVNTTQTDSKTVYDMSGRRVANPKKGIYIVGGKKMVK